MTKTTKLTTKATFSLPSVEQFRTLVDKGHRKKSSDSSILD